MLMENAIRLHGSPVLVGDMEPEYWTRLRIEHIHPLIHLGSTASSSLHGMARVVSQPSYLSGMAVASFRQGAGPRKMLIAAHSDRYFEVWTPIRSSWRASWGSREGAGGG